MKTANAGLSPALLHNSRVFGDPNSPEAGPANGDGQTPAPSPSPGDNPGAPAAVGDTTENHMIPKARLDAEAAKRRGLETEVQAAKDALIQGIPENLRALAPAGGTVSDLTTWIAAAKDAGLFNGAATVPETAPRPQTGPKDRDLSNLPPVARMAHGYSGMK